MNIEQFKKLEYQDYRNMTTEELRSLVRYGANVLNRRINALERAKSSGKSIATDALDYVERTGGLFNLVSDQMSFDKNGKPNFDKDRIELMRELKREQYFANLQSSKVKSSQAVQAYREQVFKDAVIDDYAKNKLGYDDKTIADMTQEEIKEAVAKDYIQNKLIEKYGEEAIANMSQEELDEATKELLGSEPTTNKAVNKVIEEYFDEFKKLREEYPVPPSDQVKEIYDTYHNEPEVMKQKLEELRGQMHEEEAELWRRASEETGYKPKWESF